MLSTPVAILRHIVKSYRVGAGLYPADCAEQARVEALLEAANAGADAAMAKVEKALGASLSGFLVGRTATVADIYLCAVCEGVNGSDAVAAWRAKVAAL